jgi:hypothetical protein
MGLADALGLGESSSSKGKKAKVEVVATPAFDHFADQAFKALHANDPAAFKDALRGAIQACEDEYEKQEDDAG